METIKVEESTTKYYVNGEWLLSISCLGNNQFVVENAHFVLEGYCEVIDDYRIKYNLVRNIRIGKNGRRYKTKKMVKENASWFAYILQEKGFVRKISKSDV